MNTTFTALEMRKIKPKQALQRVMLSPYRD